eukprot:COSAG02_NODE_3571_length_6533_cov_8.215981_3_plen_86_part_00
MPLRDKGQKAFCPFVMLSATKGIRALCPLSVVTWVGPYVTMYVCQRGQKQDKFCIIDCVYWYNRPLTLVVSWMAWLAWNECCIGV